MSYGPLRQADKSITAVLGDAARACTRPQYKRALLDAAYNVTCAVADLERNPTTERMQHLNSMWALAVRLYENRPMEAPPPAPRPGDTDAARLAA